MKKLISFLYMLAILGFISGCVTVPASENPGSGKAAARGFTTTASVISALEVYQQQKGAYPNSIKELYPHFMTIIPKIINGYPLEYRRVGPEYALSFRYKESALNECTYSPQSKWNCRAL